MNDFPIDIYFSLREFECPCCGAVRINKDFVQLLHQIRVDRGMVRITPGGGGYRCPAFQKGLHAARAQILKTRLVEPLVAAHVEGKAADISIYSLSTSEKVPFTKDDVPYLKSLGFSGIGIGKTGWAHVDTAHDIPAIWEYDH